MAYGPIVIVSKTIIKYFSLVDEYRICDNDRETELSSLYTRGG